MACKELLEVWRVIGNQIVGPLTFVLEIVSEFHVIQLLMRVCELVLLQECLLNCVSLSRSLSAGDHILKSLDISKLR